MVIPGDGFICPGTVLGAHPPCAYAPLLGGRRATFTRPTLRFGLGGTAFEALVRYLPTKGTPVENLNVTPHAPPYAAPYALRFAAR